MAYRILSIDGGGVRGAYAAALLEKLVEKEAASPGQSFVERADLVAGTSTGGIIALGLAFGLTPKQLVKLYRENADEIFDDSWLDDVKDLGKISGADYGSENLEAVLRKTFQDGRLKDLDKKVLVPSFDLDAVFDGQRSWKPKFFHNFDVGSDGDRTIVSVAMSTSAAPTYFPSYDGFIDGGVVANNPSVAALAQAIDAETGKQRLEDVALLSIGTGRNPTFIKGNALDWGFAQWAKPLLSLMVDGSMGVADYQCSRLLGDRYRRLSPVLGEAIQLDEAEKVDRLIALAQKEDVDPVVPWLQQRFQ